MAEFNPATKYTHTTRKVFDKSMDRIEVRRQRDREDHRNDMAALGARLSNLEAIVEKILRGSNQHGCIDPACKYCDDTMEYDPHATGGTPSG